MFAKVMILVAIIISVFIFVLALVGGFYLFLVRGTNPQIVGSLVFGVIGVTLIGLGGVFAWDNYSFTQRAVSAPGEVIRVEERLEQNAEERKLITIYVPKVRFSTWQNQVIEFNGPSSRFREYEQGAHVEVLYLSEQPEGAQIKGFNKLWLLAAGLGGIGVVFIGIALRMR